MKRVILIIVILIANLSLAQNSDDNKPNIIIFMADDMGYADAGFTGAKDIKTPNLDALASNGVIFTQGYANHPFCGPSRAALLSGRYPYRFGFETNPAYDPANPLMGIDPKEKLFPARLQEAGYVTGGVGKWHLGASQVHHPNNRGFDYFYGFLGGGHDYFTIDLTKEVWEGYKQGLIRNDQPAGFEGYLTTALSRDAAQFVKNNKDNPFFLYVAYNAPHQPLQAPEEDIKRYSHIKDGQRRRYAAMVDVMDRGIGEVINELKNSGIYENTLIFFLSDNGGPQPNPKTGKGGNASSNEPFRGGKGNMYEGGVHVPFIASWPNKIKAGITYDYPVNSLDIARTAVDLAGADATSAQPMEGVNLIPYVLGEKKGAPHDAIFWRGGNGKIWSVVSGDKMKYVKDKDSGQKEPELFDLPKDITESKDISGQNPKVAYKLKTEWEAWDKMNIPIALPAYKIYHKERNKFYEEAMPNRTSKFQEIIRDK